MQVLVLAVQNAVPYAVLGAATSGVTLLARHRRLAGHGACSARSSPAGLRSQLTGASLPPSLRAAVAGGGRLTGEQIAAAAGRGARRVPARLRRRPHARLPSPRRSSRWSASLLSWLLRGAPAARDRGDERRARGRARRAEGRRLARARSSGAIALAHDREQRQRFHRGVAERAGRRTSARARPGRSCASTSTASPARARMAEAQGIPDERIAEVLAELRGARPRPRPRRRARARRPRAGRSTERVVAARRDRLDGAARRRERRAAPGGRGRCCGGCRASSPGERP